MKERKIQESHFRQLISFAVVNEPAEQSVRHGEHKNHCENKKKSNRTQNIIISSSPHSLIIFQRIRQIQFG